MGKEAVRRDLMELFAGGGDDQGGMGRGRGEGLGEAFVEGKRGEKRKMMEEGEEW